MSNLQLRNDNAVQGVMPLSGRAFSAAATAATDVPALTPIQHVNAVMRGQLREAEKFARRIGDAAVDPSTRGATLECIEAITPFFAAFPGIDVEVQATEDGETVIIADNFNLARRVLLEFSRGGNIVIKRVDDAGVKRRTLLFGSEPVPEFRWLAGL